MAFAGLIEAASLRRDPSLVSALLVAMVGATVGISARQPVTAALSMACLLAFTALPGVGNAAPDVSFVAPAIAAYAVAARANRLAAVVALVALTTSLEIGGIRSGNWVPWLYVQIGPWIVGRVVRSRRNLVVQLEARTRELDRERNRFARLAVRRERAQIARDLHDIVSHNMAVMVVQAGAARVAPAPEPERIAEAFRSIRAAGDAALAEMDQLVDVLGSRHHGRHAEPTLATIAELVVQARLAGLDVTAQVAVQPGVIAPEIEHAAYRAIQEGLTNVLKHAPGAHVELRLETHEELLEIEVNNRMATNAGTLSGTGSGLGLVGIGERIRARSGDFSAGPMPGGGWRFSVRLPVRPTA